MDIFLHNTFTNKKELFTPIKADLVSMYNCGPTVYNYAHIGNLRAYVFADILRRMFEFNGYKVKQVINITDVGHLTSNEDVGDDKVEQAAKKEGKSAKDITNFYTEAFFKDLDELNISRAQITFPKATDYIPEQIEMVKTLEEKGFTYQTSDGIYFDTSKFPEYGKLGNINLKGLEEGARIGVQTERKNPTDFALWKFSVNTGTREQEWESPWGVGFPGWHIECSAMSKKLLGVTFDIHTGGIDHIPVHHNNEIAQSLCANDAPFVNYWMHSAFLNVGSEKMAKSEGNFIRLETLKEKGVNPLAFRYLMLTARYSSPMEFSWEALVGAETTLNKLRNFVQSKSNESGESNETKIKYYKDVFKQHINDDLDTPKAVALVWELIKDEEVSNADKKDILLSFDSVLGLKLDEKKIEVEIPKEISDLVIARDTARSEKNWQLSDELRKQIEDAGFEVMDTPDGTKIDKGNTYASGNPEVKR